ncbi:glycoprotein Xg-like isoform X5 [Ovis canadensis]|uniref:glycoprotein Xg isoform X4 n=1 Tax=Ovis canadensis TaxID=37174 RepID=UPI0037535E4A
MEAWRDLLFCLTLLCVLLRVRGENGDFDLADALDDPEPTKKPSSGIYPNPRPPYHPQPGNPDNSGNIYPKPRPPYHPQPGNPDGGNIYPRPKPPPPRPQPGNSGGFLSDSDLVDGGRYPPRPPAGGDGYSTQGNLPGNTIAKIASPIVSVVVVTLIGAAVSYYNRRRNCLRTNEPRTV